jgi:membrane protease subunit HflK
MRSAWLYESKSPAETIVQVAESSVREVVGKMKMDAALAEERDQIAPRVRQLMQTILDRYKIGVEVVGINLQQGGVRPPEQVQAAFDDVLKAGQERERAKNDAQAYANNVVPLATGTSSRLKEESEAYKARIVAQAQGDAGRFSAVLAEYQKAPQVTRDRMYTDAMQQIYASTTKVLVDTKARLQPAVPASGQDHAAGRQQRGRHTRRCCQPERGRHRAGPVVGDSGGAAHGRDPCTRRSFA